MTVSNIIICLGPPGSSKETQASMLATHLGYAHLSTRELICDELDSGREEAR